MTFCNNYKKRKWQDDFEEKEPIDEEVTSDEESMEDEDTDELSSQEEFDQLVECCVQKVLDRLKSNTSIPTVGATSPEYKAATSQI